MRQPRVLAALAVSFFTAAVAGQTQPIPRGLGAIGEVNYVEEQASIDGRPLAHRSSSGVQLSLDSSISTQVGSIEVLLTPGAFLRAGNRSSIKMVALGPARTEVMLEKGRATIEATGIPPGGKLRVNLSGATVRIMTNGLYEFDAKRQQVHVFAGAIEVRAYGSNIQMHTKQWMDLSQGDSLVPYAFSESSYVDDGVYAFTAQRSAYLAEANADAAATQDQSPVQSQATFGIGIPPTTPIPFFPAT
jgi:hypothetical protein